MNGRRELAIQFLAPHMRQVFMSGYTANGLITTYHGVLDQGAFAAEFLFQPGAGYQTAKGVG